jgi:hypothetical protein
MSGDSGGRVVVIAVLVALLIGAIALAQRDDDTQSAGAAPVEVDGPLVPSDDAVSSAWYCAAGAGAAAGAPGDETVFVSNLSPHAVTATVTVERGSDDDPATSRLELDAYERAAVRVGSIAVADSPGVVVEVVGGPAIVEHAVEGNGDLGMGPCASEPSATWYFASGGTVRGSTQSLELFNPFGDDAIVDVRFLTDGGVQEPQALQGMVVARRTKVKVPVDMHVARQDRVATVVRARTGRLVAEQVRTFDGTEGRHGLTLSLGANEPRRSWVAPLAADASRLPASLTIANPGLSPTEVEVSVLLSGDGVLTPQTVDVPSRSVVRVDVSTGVPGGDAYAVVARARGDGPVVVEAEATPSNGSATLVAAPAPARRWALSGGVAGTSSAVVAVNRGNAPVTVELRAYVPGDAQGPTSAPAIAVAPGKVARFHLDEWGTAPDQVLVVSADGPIVAGREIEAGGVSLALGVPFR